MGLSKQTFNSKGVDKKTFKLATYNVQGVYRQTIVENIAAMKQQGVKIFCLQEIRTIAGQEFVGEIIKKALGKEWTYEHFLYEENHRDLGLAIFWDTQMVNAISLERLALPKLEKPTAFEKLILKITKSTSEILQRKAFIGTFTIDNQIMRIVNVHLDWQGGFAHKKKQLKFLVENLNKNKKIVAEIICGDFNTIIDLKRISKKRKHIQALFGQEFFDATYNIPWTMDIQRSIYENRKLLHKILKKLHLNLHQKLDYIWGKGIEIIETDMLDVEGSDHFPIVATVYL